MNEFLLLGDAGSPGYEGIFTDLNTTFWSAVLRIMQAMLAAAPQPTRRGSTSSTCAPTSGSSAPRTRRKPSRARRPVAWIESPRQ